MPPATNSPLGNFPELAKAYASSFARIGNQTKSAGDEYNTGIQVEAAEAQRKAELEAKAQRLKDLADPTKYQVKRKEDGGFDFFDPEGQQIDIATYSQRTGVRPVDVLKSSDNPIDQQYLQDYDRLQTYMQALRDKDTETLDAMRRGDERLKDFDDAGGIDRLLQLFKQSYNRYYTPRNVDPRAWGQRPGTALFGNPNLVAEDTTGIGS